MLLALVTLATMNTNQIAKPNSFVSQFRTYLIAAVLGVVVGLIVCGFIWAVSTLKDLLWQNQDWNYNGWTVFAICLIGGLIVGLINFSSRGNAESMHDLDEAFEEVQQAEANEIPKFSKILQRITLGISSLGFGGPLGPEAPIIEIASGLSARMAGLLKLARSQAVNLSLAGALGGLFGAPLALATSEFRQGEEPKPSSWKLLNLGPEIVAGVSAFLVFKNLLPGNGFHVFESSVAPAETLFIQNLFLIVIVSLVVSTWIRLIVDVIAKVHNVLWKHLPGGAITAGLLSGAVLGIGGMTNKLVLFSGHHEIQELLHASHSWKFLIGVMLLKVIVLVACLAGGWFGGQIFPMAFIGATIALSLGDLATSSDALLLAGVGFVAAVNVSLRRPILSIILGLLFFPPETWLALMLAVGCSMPFVSGRNQQIH